MAKRRILLVDDEVSVLLTVKAVLEISGFEVDTAASAREAKSKLKLHEYHMIITDMRMEHDAAGHEVILAARSAPYRPAVALLTALSFSDEYWQEIGADKMLVKPMQTRVLIRQIEKLLEKHTAILAKRRQAASAAESKAAKKIAAKKKVTQVPVKRVASKKLAEKKTMVKKTAAKKKAAR